MDELTIIETDKKFAIIIAIENYRKSPSSTIRSVKYAKNDALGFRKLLIDHLGFQEENIISLVDGEAVKSALENDLPYYISQLSNEHQFIFYYVGHGFYQDGHNKLTCWDTNTFNLSGTSVSIKDVLLDPLLKSGCSQSLIFLDCCSSFLEHAPGSRDVISDFNDTEFEQFIGLSSYNAIFMSCSPGEKSYSSDKLNHGIWTWHLIEALSGNKEKAIVKDYYITDSSLKNFLSFAVPAYVTKEMHVKATQKPYAKIDSSNDFLIRKLPEPDRDIDRSLPNLKFKYEDAFFRKIEFERIKNASGFQSGYKVPKWRNRTTDQFVRKVFEPDIAKEIQDVYENTKAILGLRKADIEYGTSDYGGSVECSIFRYYVDIEHSAARIEEAKFTRKLLIRVRRSELPEKFDSIFPFYVDELIIPIDGKIDFDDLVNKFENLREEQGGSVTDNEMDGIMEYITDGGTSIKVDAYNSELIITHYSPMRTVDLIDKSINDLKRISTYKIRLLS